jgi:hypothetical protein
MAFGRVAFVVESIVAGKDNLSLGAELERGMMLF